MVGKKGRSGRPIKYPDRFHENVRRAARAYYERNREAVLLGMRLKISVKEAHKLLAEQKKGGKKK